MRTYRFFVVLILTGGEKVKRNSPLRLIQQKNAPANELGRERSLIYCK
mgnify:CR=1 FL=1